MSCRRNKRAFVCAFICREQHAQRQSSIEGRVWLGTATRFNCQYVTGGCNFELYALSTPSSRSPVSDKWYTSLWPSWAHARSQVRDQNCNVRNPVSESKINVFFSLRAVKQADTTRKKYYCAPFIMALHRFGIVKIWENRLLSTGSVNWLRLIWGAAAASDNMPYFKGCYH